MRLVGTPGRCAGRVEVFYQGVWGTVCDDLWDLSEANIICRQLECGWAISAPGEAHFGEGSGKILLDNVHCRGHEKHLGECSHAGWFSHNCGHREDASVICSGNPCAPPRQCPAQLFPRAYFIQLDVKRGVIHSQQTFHLPCLQMLNLQPSRPQVRRVMFKCVAHQHPGEQVLLEIRCLVL